MRREKISERVVRTFVGIPLDPEICARLAVAQREMRVIGEGLRVNASWEKPEKMHVTLKFLGDLAEARLDHLSRSLDEIARRHAAFEFDIDGVGGFPAGKAPHVVYAAITSGVEELTRLAADVDIAAAAAGVAGETRPWNGHVTLARIRAAPKRLRPATLAPGGIHGGRVAVAGFNLYASTIEKTGSVHRVLSHHALIRDIRTDP
jgi:2'-5' RNA ligase